MSKREEHWQETKSKVRNAIVDMKESGDAIGIEPSGIADDIADMVYDELGITLREDGDE